jgi:hypothetical protein
MEKSRQLQCRFAPGEYGPYEAGVYMGPRVNPGRGERNISDHDGDRTLVLHLGAH